MTNNLSFQFISTASFQDIKPLWDELWPGRTDIKPMSSLRINGEIDMDIYKKYQPKFWISCFQNQPIACLSGHPTSQELFRLRGLYVKMEYRKQGVASRLVQVALDYAKSEKYKLAWTLPKTNTLKFYESCGFYKISKEITENMSYGPNFLAVYPLLIF